MAKKDTKLENLSKTVHMLIEEIRLSETEGLGRIFMDVYSQQADMMTDSRQQTAGQSEACLQGHSGHSLLWCACRK